MGRPWKDLAGRLLVGLAVLLHRTLTDEAARRRQQEWRNAVLRAAHRRGVPVEVLASRTRLTQGWVRHVVIGRRPPAVDEAA
ncbi:hypothetical protein AB0L35_30475 [Streptomyces sp. NPDC052309]|uniref:Uncharacterized protein n=1 Tax=Streptomyces griseicoloratus TaxID=2752516 RepID=A0A926KZT8_9ACTN|nr:hypothetical protein [Streptomyces griseicoloratus]MBD0418754.1 hypothetical protein [Streptomyces griseicoloratus]